MTRRTARGGTRLNAGGGPRDRRNSHLVGPCTERWRWHNEDLVHRAVRGALIELQTELPLDTCCKEHARPYGDRGHYPPNLACSARQPRPSSSYHPRSPFSLDSPRLHPALLRFPLRRDPLPITVRRQVSIANSPFRKQCLARDTRDSLPASGIFSKFFPHPYAPLYQAKTSPTKLSRAGPPQPSCTHPDASSRGQAPA